MPSTSGSMDSGRPATSPDEQGSLPPGELLKRLAFLILTTSCLALTGCAREDSARNDGAISFRVNPERLGERFERADAGITLRAPAGWKALPDSLLAVAMERLKSEGAPIGTAEPRMLAVYREEPEGATLAVSSYAAELPPSSRDSLALLHLKRMRSQHPAGQVEDGRFAYRGYEIVQLRAVDSTIVAFKLLLSRRAQPLVQLDYVVPRSVYPRELEAVESSIGSLEPKS